MRPWWLRLFRKSPPPMLSLGAVLGLIVLHVAIDALKPWPIKWLVDDVLGGRGDGRWKAFSEFLPGAGSRSGQITWLAAATILFFLLGQIVRLIQNYLQNGLGARATYQLGARVFEHLQNLSLLFHTRRSSGDLVRRILNDTRCVRELLLDVVVPLATSIATIGLMLAIMWRLDWKLALIALGVVAPLAVLIRVLYPEMSRRGDEQEATQSELMVLSERTLGATSVIQMFGHEQRNDEEFRRATDQSLKAYVGMIIAQLKFKIGTGTVMSLGTAAVMFVGGLHVLNGRLTVGELLVFLAYVGSLYAPLEALAYISTTLASAGASGRRVLEILDAQEQVHESPHARPLTKQPSLSLQLQDVTFGYEAGRPILHGVTLEVPAGKTVALVGPTGAGKSTLAALVPRLVDPWSGKVLLGGQDVRDLTLASVRSAVAVVPQEPLLLPLTIRQNIAYGWPEASDEQVKEAADAAAASEFIDRLPDGYNTVIGERGATLSAGQRQRIAIARALLRDASLLVLDEPTSALDATNESLVVRGLAERAKGKLTVLVIAHRLSTVREADIVAVLEHGRIVELGSPPELISAGGMFARFHELQFGSPSNASPPAKVGA